MKHYICPHCFNVFDNKNILFRCHNDHSKIESSSINSSSKPSKAKALEGDDRYFSAPNSIFKLGIPKQCECPTCNTLSDKHVCPNCNAEIDIVNNSFFISIAGSKGSGKTVFLGSLINELKSKMSAFGYSYSMTSETEEYIESHCKVVEGDVLPNATPGRRPPVIINFKKESKEFSLVLIDAAGEDFRRGVPQDNIKHVGYSDLIIYLIDTLQIEQVRMHPNVVELAQHHEKNIDIDTSLEVATDAIRRELKNDNKLIKIPIAVCFSLTDIIKMIYDDTAQKPIFLYESQHVNEKSFSTERAKRVNYSIEYCLREWRQHNFLKKLKLNYKKVTFFGFSSLGTPPREEDQVIKHLAPFNVLDPIIWLLANKRFIKKR